jgi:peptide/nickel transport system ATP-binding protein
LPDLLKVSKLSVEFQTEKSRSRALDNASIEVPSTMHTLGLVGESGSGKSTLAMSIMNLIEPPGRITSGQIEFEGRDILGMKKSELRRFRWEEVSVVYQSAMNSLNPVKSVVDPIVEVLMEHRHLSRREATQRAMELLEEVEIDPKRAHDFPHEFSGGMRQRVVIALALALSPKLLIADEPTSALDVVTQKQVLGLIRKEVIQKDLSLIFITHEIALLKGLVNHVAVMFAGEIVEFGPARMVLNSPSHPYTEELMGSLITDSTKLGLENQNGRHYEEPPMFVEGGGCKYAPRCKYAFERCQREAPVAREIEKGLWVACHKYK